METKKQKSSVSKKGGRNPFGRLAIAAGSLGIGAAVVEAVEKWRASHPQPAAEESVEEKEEKPETTQDTRSTESKKEEEPGNPQPEQHEEERVEPEEPQPIDPADHGQAEATGEADATLSDEEVARRIVESEEIDPVDNNYIALMNVGKQHTVYTANGEVDAFDVEFNDPYLAGYPFKIADTDGDGFYDTILLDDGTPADIRTSEDPDASLLNDYLPMAAITKSDLEEMHETGGGYLKPDSRNEMAMNDDPTKDMIDENGKQVAMEQTEQQATQPDLDDEDEAAYLALLSQLLEEEEEEDEDEGGTVLVDKPENMGNEEYEDEEEELLAALYGEEDGEVKESEEEETGDEMDFSEA